MLTDQAPEKNVTDIARRFSELLHAAIGDDRLARVVELNAQEGESLTCHSHDFTDANEWMLQAFAHVTDRNIDPSSDDDTKLFTEAWNLAKAAGFDADIIATAGPA